MHFSFSKSKVLFWRLTKYSIAIKTDEKIPSLLPNILGQSKSSTGPMQIYRRRCFINSFQLS